MEGRHRHLSIVGGSGIIGAIAKADFGGFLACIILFCDQPGGLDFCCWHMPGKAHLAMHTGMHVSLWRK